MANDLARHDVPAVTPEQDLDTVMRIFGGKNREELPVVDPGARGESGPVLGVINRRHLIDTYNRELMKRDMVSGLGGGLTATATEEVILDGEHRMGEVEAPGVFVKRTLGELDVRSRYGVQVLLVRRSGTGQAMELVPGPEIRIEHGDRLVVMGRARDLKRLRAI